MDAFALVGKLDYAVPPTLIFSSFFGAARIRSDAVFSMRINQGSGLENDPALSDLKTVD